MQKQPDYRQLYNSMLEAFNATGLNYFVVELIYDEKGKAVDVVYREVSPSTEELLGKSKQQIIGKSRRELFGNVHDEFPEKFGCVIKTDKPSHFESYGAGLNKCYDVYAWKKTDNQVAVILTDITERKRAEEEVTRLASFPTLNPSPIVEADFAGKISYLNPAAKQLFADIETSGLAHPFLFDWGNAVVTFKGKTSGTFSREVKVDEHWYHQMLFLAPNSQRIRIYALDITFRKKTEEALKNSEENYKQLLKYAPTAIYELDYKTQRFKSVNDAMCQMTGYSMEELLEMNPADLLDSESRERFKERTRKGLSGEKIGDSVEYRGTMKDGRELWIILNVKPTYKDGKLDGALVVGHDITERKKMEQAIKQRNEDLEHLQVKLEAKAAEVEEYACRMEELVKERTEKLAFSANYARNLIEASLDPLVTISSEGKITDVNKATEEATGCSREELIGSNFSEYFTEPEKAENGYKKVLAMGFVRDYPLTIKAKSGKGTAVLYNATVYCDDAGKVQGVFAAARDITELRKAEAQADESERKLKDAERLATIGATAGMVGHDIRNPLQAITSDVYLAKTELAGLPESEEKKNILESLVETEKNLDYINKIVQDLQDYARPLNPKSEETDIKLLVKKLFTKNRVPRNIRVAIKVAEDARKIRADAYYLNRIMYNLVTNSVQAMPSGGKLTINAEKLTDDIVITVEDTGVGIPLEIQGKMFTAMFTTKSKGQGFGLPVVKRMTEALGGTVTFESELNKGTKFIIRLPKK